MSKKGEIKHEIIITDQKIEDDMIRTLHLLINEFKDDMSPMVTILLKKRLDAITQGLNRKSDLFDKLKEEIK